MASRLDTQTNIRLPADLKRALVDAAAESGRSLSSEIENRLRESFDGRPEGAEDPDRQLEVNAVLKGLRDTIAEIARNDNERDDGVRAMGRDLHALCARALPLIDDEERYRNLVRMLADVGVSMQAGDMTDAQARMRAIFYLASDRPREQSET